MRTRRITSAGEYNEGYKEPTESTVTSQCNYPVLLIGYISVILNREKDGRNIAIQQ